MRLGLIAMSGVRAHNPELTQLGLTLPGFIERSKTIASLPSLGLLTLAGMTPHDVDLEYREIEALTQAPDLSDRYDVVAISSFSAQIKEAYELADNLRGTGTHVVLGGLHVTSQPEEALKHADTVVIGEGEPVWPRLISDLMHGKPLAIYDSRKASFDLAAAPMPRFELLDPDHYNRLTVQTQRGCPFNCEFCAASVRLSPAFRVKPVQKVIAEIREIKSLWRNPFVEFADDNSFVNRRHAKRLLRALAEEGIRWFTETDISIARDDELLALLRDSGCAQVLIGLENPSRAGLRGIEKNSNWKEKQREFYFSAIEKIQSHGVSVNGCFILGLDGTGPENFEEVADFVRNSKLHEVQITVQTAFPGTPLHARLQRSGRIIKQRAWELCTLFDVNFQPERMTVAELEGGFRELARELYSSESRRQREASFREQLRQVVRAERRQRGISNERQMG